MENFPQVSKELKNIFVDLARRDLNQYPQEVPETSSYVIVILAQRLSHLYNVHTTTGRLRGTIWKKTTFDPNTPPVELPSVAKLLKFKGPTPVGCSSLPILVKLDVLDPEQKELHKRLEETITFLRNQRISDPPNTERSLGVVHAQLFTKDGVGYIEVRLTVTDPY
jgi:hypothetical protein